MYEKQFAQRVSELRKNKGISARDMSLSLGQNPGYINAIENGRTMPRMGSFFNMCEFFGITPLEFFDEKAENPESCILVAEQVKRLSSDQTKIILAMMDEFIKANGRNQ